MARKKATVAAVETKEETKAFSAEPVVGTVNSKKGLNLREGAGKENKIIRILCDGEKLNIIGESGDWWQAPEGYVMKQFVVIADE